MGHWGWGPVFWPSVNYVAMRESGWNIHARNPSSGAYGIAQGITGPSWYNQWPGGNANTIAGQVIGFFDYIAQRYKTPLNAATHEAAFNWYHDGGTLPEDVFGIGPSGARYKLEGGERVVGGGDDLLIRKLDRLIAALEAVPGRTAAGVARALDTPRGTQAQAARLGARL